MSTGSETLLGWLLTYFIHSTVLLGAAWAATRWWLRSPAVREAVWRGALVAGLVTASIQTAGFAPKATRFAMPSARVAPAAELVVATEPPAAVAERRTRHGRARRGHRAAGGVLSGDRADRADDPMAEPE